MTIHRLHLPQCQTGVVLPLAPDAAHYARHVLRLARGARLRVFDGCGHEYDAMIESATSARTVVRVGQAVASAPESPLHALLAFAPLSADLTSLVIQKAVELGVRELSLVLTARTEPAGRALLASSRLERLRRVAVAATAQSGRAFVPQIRALTFEELLRLPVSGPKLLCCERPIARPLPTLGRAPAQVLLATGPAGGWEDSEVDRAVAAGFAPLALGPRILRAETGSLAAVCAAQLVWGDLSASPWKDGGTPQEETS